MMVAPLTEQLVKPVVQLHRHVLGDTVNAQVGEWFLTYLYRQLLHLPRLAKAWVAVEDDQVVGFVSLATDYQALSTTLMQQLSFVSKIRAGLFFLVHPKLAWQFLQQRRFGNYLKTAVPAHSAYVLTLGVATNQQGKGVGRLLMDAATRQLADRYPIYLDTKVDNHQAIRFYERYGFQIIDSKLGNVLCRLTAAE
jgi:ribosomal protein S18 acetylase RimI-like enzyme